MVQQAKPLCFAVIWASQELPGWWHTFFKHFTSCLRSWTHSGAKFPSTGCAHCSRCMPVSSHSPWHPQLSSLQADLWVVFLNSCLTFNKTWNRFGRCSNRSMMVPTSQGYSKFSRGIFTSLEEKKRVKKWGKGSTLFSPNRWARWEEKVKIVIIVSKT